MTKSFDKTLDAIADLEEAVTEARTQKLTADPKKPRNQGECPCHASTYDPLTGMATDGPAAKQSPPSNTLPRLDLEADADGFLWILPPKWGVNANGVIGYGRYTN